MKIVTKKSIFTALHDYMGKVFTAFEDQKIISEEGQRIVRQAIEQSGVSLQDFIKQDIAKEFIDLVKELDDGLHQEHLAVNKNIIRILNKKDDTHKEIDAINKRLDLLSQKFDTTASKVDEFLANFTIVEHLDVDPGNPKASATPSGGVKEDLLNTVDSERHYASIRDMGEEILTNKPQIKIERDD